MQILSSVAHIQPYFKAFLIFALIIQLFMGGSTPHEFDWGAVLLHERGTAYKTHSESL